MRGSELVRRAAAGWAALRAASSGHLWTLAPVVGALARPVPLPAGVAFDASADDPHLGPVPLSGVLHEPPQPTADLLVVVHGLGGDVDSPYARRAARAAMAAGLACLRLNLRGADGSGADYYHAGLTVDLHAALASPALDRYERILLLGYSLGGHLVLRLGSEPHDRRVAAIAAICAPLELDRAASDIDQPWRWPYRRYLLHALHGMLRQVERRRGLPLPLEEALAIRHMRFWDDRVVAPRFGFRDAADYYAAVSVGPRLGEVAPPALLVNSRHDPMVQAGSIEPALRRATAGRPSLELEVRWLERGAGHVGFAPGTDLGEAAPRGLEPQVIAWLRRRLRG